MPIHIANFFEADRRSAKAGEPMTTGMVVKVSDDAGQRRLRMLLDADSAELVNGKYGVVWKTSNNPFAVESGASVGGSTGDRTITIASADAVVEVRRGAIIEYTADLLHSSLDPARGGATPVAGDSVFIKSSQWCRNTGVGGAIASPIVARVYRAFGTKVLIELV